MAGGSTDMARIKNIRFQALASLALALSAVAAATVPPTGMLPSVPGVDSPELAALGPDKVGFRSLIIVNPAQPDLLASDPKTGAA